MTKIPYVVPFSRISKNDVSLVGGKNASLGHMIRSLKKAGIPVPDGFAITTHACARFLSHNTIDKEIGRILKTIDHSHVSDIKAKGERIRRHITRGSFPDDVREEIIAAYAALGKRIGRSVSDVAVRSSATAEYLPAASFAGQLESFLHVQGERQLLDRIKRCFASLYGARAISYVHDQGFNYKAIAVSVG